LNFIPVEDEGDKGRKGISFEEVFNKNVAQNT
jgi:hypothetical protein